MDVARNTNGLIARFGVTITINLIFGFIFLNAGGRDNGIPIDFGTHFGAMTMVSFSYFYV